MIDLVAPNAAVRSHAEHLRAFVRNPVLTRLNRADGRTEELRVEQYPNWLEADEVLAALAAEGATQWREAIPVRRKLLTQSGWVSLQSSP